MLCIDSQTNNPYYNLAAEEYFLRQSDEEYFIMWESGPSVIVGKHQNALSEINYRYISERGILAARRLTGGGTVFHGQGNINFTFIRNGSPGHLVNFSGHIEPVIGFLKSLGIKAQKGSKHEILVNGMKVSGNAEHVYKNRVLHHGTLLFDADLETLRSSIRRSSGTYNDRAVQSNRADVINISDCLDSKIGRAEFSRRFYNFIVSSHGATDFSPGLPVVKNIEKLAREKYSTWEWIYGWSPDYVFSNRWENSAMELEITLEVHRGIITSGQLSGCAFPADKVKILLTGIRHSKAEIEVLLQEAGIDAIAGKEFDDLVYALF